MTDLATRLPTRRPDLVSWRASDDGRYVVRNRASGESFELGQEEHFLLERLDGRRTGEDICRAFADEFGEPLPAPDLDEFVQLAAARGLLQRGEPASCPETASASTAPLEHAEPVPGARTLWRQAGSQLLKGASKILQWPAHMLSAAAARLDLLRFKRLDFVSRPDDIFIVTYPRSGTTWMQMILYQLTTSGCMNFPHIAEYCPWFERSARSARAFETRPSPRLFKSHLPYRQVPKGPGKYLYVARDGPDVAVSYYHLYRAYNGYEGTFAEFFDRFLRGKLEFGSWFQHVAGWWAHPHDPNVLFLTYEELARDLEKCIHRIAAFISRPVRPERLPAILEHSSFAFMKLHEPKFDPVFESLWEQGIQLKSFLRNGKVGDGAVSLTDEQRARFDQAFGRRLAHLGIPAGTRESSP